MPDRRLVIIDGYSLLFRAFYGTRFLSTSDGRPTNALFGFVNMLLQIFGDERWRPDAIVVALDAPGKTFRHADFPEYKGTRRETPQELISQLDFSRELIQDLNIPVFEIPGYEADDIVGTLSRQAEEKGYRTIIVTGDHDSLQLVDECVQVLMPQNGPVEPKLYGIEEVRARYGFEPIQMVDYKAMAGDSSDNIPGVPGIGEKSAKTLIEQFGGVDGILANMEQVDPKFRKKLEPAVESMLMSRKLATIDREAPVEYSFAPYQIDQGHLERAKTALTSLEFRSQVKRIDAAMRRYLIAGDAPVEATAAVVREALETERLPDVSSAAELLEWIGSRPWAILPAAQSGQADLFADPTPEQFAVAIEGKARLAAKEAAISAVRSLTQQMVGHDVKPLYRSAGTPLPPPLMDTLLAGYVLQSGRASYILGDLMNGYLESAVAESPLDQAAALLPLAKELEDRLEKEGQTRVLREVELPLVPILAEMEARGIGVSRSELQDFSKGLSVEIDKVQTLVYELAGKSFNIGSPKQIGEILFEEMGLPGRKTKTGWATGAEVLSELAPTVPLAGEILTYRELTKLKSTYADALPKMIASDGRIHTTFNQAVAATGRLSSNDPNLQNIPIRTELGRQIRRAFHAAPGMELLSLDYSQIELRVLAHMCQDEALVSAFQERVDVHTVTAALMFGVAQAEVSKEQRRLAKMLNYAVLYGVGGFGLANQLGAGFSQSEASALIKQYNERFPAVKDFTDGIVEEARSKGFTTTLIGRRRYFPDIHNQNRALRQYAERQAMNAPIQGTAADMIKMAMIDVQRRLGSGSDCKMLLQVHDELVFETPVGNRDWVEPIRHDMEEALPLLVPVEVDAKSGENWLEMPSIPRP